MVGSVLVVGGGVAGMQASLDLADAGYFVYLVEKTGAIGGAMVQLDKTFPTNDCSMCIVAPRMVECERHPNIAILSLSEVTKIAGNPGQFRVTIEEKPRFVDTSLCISCGVCAQNCPATLPDGHNVGIGNRKAISIQYPQAIPSVYQIHPEACLRMKKKSACALCEQVCEARAIRFDDARKIHELPVGAIILAPGFEPYDPTGSEAWGYGVFTNVITSLELERYLAATGPSRGRLIRPSDGRPVRKMAFLQCVGSRDDNCSGNGYCSSVCCMYALKEAMAAKRHNPALSISIYYMDMRTPGKGFDAYMEKARIEEGIRFIRCRIHGVEPHGKGEGLLLHSISEEGRQIEELFDVVVLSVGLQTPKHVRKLAERAGIQLSVSNFASTSEFSPQATSRQGIFACGAFSGPKNISRSVVEGSAAAAKVGEMLSPVRGQVRGKRGALVTLQEVGGQPRTGVFICYCGSNIAEGVDVTELARYSGTLPEVVHVEQSNFACSQEAQTMLIEAIREKRLNRVVVAACTPRTHEVIFRRALSAAGLNEYLLEIANIRNQDSWVHHDIAPATSKAKDLVHMAVVKVNLARPIQASFVSTVQRALVVGGGIAGMTAALNLAEQGFPVDLVEQDERLGGNALNLKHTYSGVHVPTQVAKLVDRVSGHEKIHIHLHTEVKKASGHVGNFVSTLKTANKKVKTIKHGVAILATGAKIYKPTEYGYKKIQCVVTAIEFEKLHELKEKHVKRGKSFVFIQCVGSREKGRMYCSKVCCTHSVQSAIELKREDPGCNVYILYRDIRTYGEREYLLKKARDMGVVFINYELHGKPVVREEKKTLYVEVWDHVLHRPLQIRTDMVILATAIVANRGVSNLAQQYRVPLDSHGFFQEAHAKLGPVDFASEGLFTAGLAQYPKPVDESVSEALAASARALRILAHKTVRLGATRAIVDEQICDGCALCIDVCPYAAIELIEVLRGEEREPAKRVRIQEALCKGCGLCQGTCPVRAVDVSGFTMEQLSSQVKAVLASQDRGGEE
ncbi:unnamed protein product [Cyprideis torosa]|uniref:Uncharacterized protein n=1 Tax=Cyprideis torosa TaxID=163714 RepID=A0A7R8WKB5_9CRUS|nr:unnamed protein product [Cyprideis torosa]CAG0901143.1 unnamed protein product [Cyprideis torosa]